MEVGAKVFQGRIIINDGEADEKITIKAGKNICLKINDIDCEPFGIYEVTSKDKIECECIKTEGKRNVHIRISEDKMKAYIKIDYIPEIQYKLKDRDVFMNLAVAAEEGELTEPPHFTVEELKNILKENGIIYGLDEEALYEASFGNSKEMLVARGDAPVTNIPSDIKLFFTPSQMVFPDPNSDEKIDYKNLFRISNVYAGNKIAEIIPEVPGKDGINVLGQVCKREYIRSLPINIKSGCKIENNDVIALIDGKAHISNNTISVNKVYAVENVNMETCNIKFSGDIEVYDSVSDNMAVKAGGSLDVSRNVNTSSVTAGTITILGNAIKSNIFSGQIDIEKKEYSEVLIKFKEILNDIVQIVVQTNRSDQSVSFPEMIKSLTELRFVDFQKIALNIVSLNIKNKIKHNKLVDYIKDHVLGYNILNLKSIYELNKLLEIVDNEIEFYDKNIIVPLDVRIGYCQDCEIKSTGNIIIGGRGEYTSNLNAMKDILFTQRDSVARGGILSAGGNISAGIIGSAASVSTILNVPLTGKITATGAYKNTTFCFGKKKITIERDMENINAFYNYEIREIQIVSSGL
ncbi:FapA family protein [Clostridium butyricum]|uniref:FapA family protein n=1 Tax=Clostridium butyricum TaxID=1492 RepID=UPI0022E29034|nr:FapA family protein [Clostridium butyricum]